MYYEEARKHASEGSPLALKRRANVTRSPKQEPQVAPQKGFMSSKNSRIQPRIPIRGWGPVPKMDAVAI